MLECALDAVRQDLRRATEDGRIAIDRGIASAQADIVRAELAAKIVAFEHRISAKNLIEMWNKQGREIFKRAGLVKPT